MTAPRAVIYVRVSSREQAEGGYSIEAQPDACRRFVSEKRWIIEDEFTELGESARTANRTAFKAMIAMLDEHHGVSYLIVHKIDRLARNLADYAAVKARLQKLGIQLVSVTEGMDQGPSGRLVECIMAAIAEFYSDNLGQEVRKGMQQKLRNGGWPHMAPVGYLNLRVTGERKTEAVLVLDPEQAPLVRKAFELYATGDYTVSALALEVAALELRNTAGRPLSRSKVAELLHNKLYAGVVVHNGVEYPGEPRATRVKGAVRKGPPGPVVARSEQGPREQASSLPPGGGLLRCVRLSAVLAHGEGPLLVLLLPRAVHHRP